MQALFTPCSTRAPTRGSRAAGSSKHSLARFTPSLVEPLMARAQSLSIARAGKQAPGPRLNVSCGSGTTSFQAPPRASRDENDNKIRLALPSKGRMAEDTMELLAACQLKIRKPNPRQYVAEMPELEAVEVWFQRASDCMRKLRYGDVDLAFVGYDMFMEFGEGDPDLVVVHNKLDYGQCYLALGVPNYVASGVDWTGVTSLEEMMAMPEWTETNPLRVVTGYQYIARQYFEKIGLKNYVLLSADGALEAAPAMGSADIILDLVSTGTTLRENNLKEIEGAKIIESEGCFVARRSALLEKPECLNIVHEMLERVEAHLRAEGQFTVTANVRGNGDAAEGVAKKLIESGIAGLNGPTIAPVYSMEGGEITNTVFAISVCCSKPALYDTVKTLRKLGGSGVLVTPLTYIFEEDPVRWEQLIQELGIPDPKKAVANA